MVRIYVSDVIDAPIEKVWALIRDFNGMPKWHPFIRDSMIEGGLTSDAVGCVRNFHLADAATCASSCSPCRIATMPASIAFSKARCR